MQQKRIQRPTDIPWSGWKKILWGVKDEIGRDRISIVAAGVAFYSFLAIFPALAALISIYGLAFNPQQVQDQLLQMASVMPEEALSILKEQLESLVTSSGGSLGWGVAIGILFSIWSANQGTSSLFEGLDIAYGNHNTRGFIKQTAMSLLFTFGAIILIILSMTLIFGFPAFIGRFDLPEVVEKIIGYARWLLLGLVAVLFLGIVYKYAPAHRVPRGRWVRVGAFVATLLWLIASWGFSFYVSNFGSYGEMYGSISAVVILMMWLYLTSYIILLGAELNSEICTHNKTKYLWVIFWIFISEDHNFTRKFL